MKQVWHLYFPSSIHPWFRDTNCQSLLCKHLDIKNSITWCVLFGIKVSRENSCGGWIEQKLFSFGWTLFFWCVISLKISEIAGFKTRFENYFLLLLTIHTCVRFHSSSSKPLCTINNFFVLCRRHRFDYRVQNPAVKLIRKRGLKTKNFLVLSNWWLYET